jgi:Ferritin-like
MIQTREALLIALTDAAELEHSLACQYLFTAFTMKQSTDEGNVSDDQLDLITEWNENIKKIARQEMSHLATVTNLLTVIGGAPHFRRPNFPQPSRYYLDDDKLPFKLEAFSVDSLKRYYNYERPEHVLEIAGPEVVPPPLSYQTVGDLYRQIRRGFETIDEKALFIRTGVNQDAAPWGMDVEPHEVRDRASALSAVDRIIAEGEATTSGGPESHFEIFKRVLAALENEIKKDPGFKPARDVIDNPLTRTHRDTLGNNVIDDVVTRQHVELFNAVYNSMILMLAQYYAFSSETAKQRETLRQLSVTVMKGVIRPLGELITKMEMGPKYPGKKAGPSFEFYGDMRLSTDAKTFWALLIERIDAELEEADRLSKLTGAPPRMKSIRTTIAIIKTKLEQAASPG